VHDHKFWITPGGGVEPDESIEAAVHRELFEETGLVIADLGVPVYYREKLLEHGSGRMLGKEHLFFVRLTEPDMISTAGYTELEQRDMHTHHRWSIDNLETTTGTVYLEGFQAIVRRLLAR
jgi:8-oxo-dGTP pyrophosphatase MutT (NUDIX family)